MKTLKLTAKLVLLTVAIYGTIKLADLSGAGATMAWVCITVATLLHQGAAKVLKMDRKSAKLNVASFVVLVVLGLASGAGVLLVVGLELACEATDKLIRTTVVDLGGKVIE